MNIDTFQHPGINLAHAGDDDHRRTAVTVFGFWAFLMSDAIIFALLFATYAAMAARTNGGPTGAQIFELSNVFIETLVLLLSSFAFGLASVALKEGRVRAIYLWMVISLLLGLCFLGLELRELTGLIASGAAPQASGFLSAFFLLVSTHGLHVFAGSIWIVVMLVQIAVLGLRPQVRSRLLRLGLFWHFLDLIWIVIFSVVYLPGVAI